MLATLHEGVRIVTVLLHPYLPAATAKLLGALGRTRDRHRQRALRRRADRRHAAGAALPEAMIDSHTHLDSCEPPNAELVAAAEAAGVDRILTVGMDSASCRSALAATEQFPQVFAAIGRHPNIAHGFDAGDLAELRALAGHDGCVAIGETGLDFYPRPRAARRPGARLRGPDRAGGGVRQAAGDPHACRRGGDAARCCASTPRASP